MTATEPLDLVVIGGGAAGEKGAARAAYFGKRVAVGERRRFTAETLLIVTGSNPFRPPGIPFDDPDVHDSDSILEIDHLPASLAVLGGGVIGCEYASMFAVLGTDVHLVERRDPLLPF